MGAGDLKLSVAHASIDIDLVDVDPYAALLGDLKP